MIIPTTFWAIHTQSDSTAHQRSYAALVSIAASKELTSENFELSDSPTQILAEIERFCPLKSAECGLSEFRTIDGICNNVEHPLWGVSEIRASIVDGIPLPNVRLLSNLFFGAADRKPLKVNMLVTHWAHFIYTDLVHIGSTQLSQGFDRSSSHKSACMQK
uniref:Uncharacterized protein n=1 Tax=Parascaris equorum TaxID=6256 RepID=A0A914RY33_PAREQ